jgi:hypothetical protein
MIRATTNMLQKTAYKKELKIKKKQLSFWGVDPIWSPLNPFYLKTIRARSNLFEIYR